MEYRKLPKGQEQISVLGLGCGGIHEAGDREIEATVGCALEHGINFLDMVASAASPYPAYGRALRGCRDKVYLQVHFGAYYDTGTYGWTTDLETIKRSVDWQLTCLKTDYIDFGFIHCIDQDEDLDQVMSDGVLDLIQDWKSQGIIHHIALSSHDPHIANRVLDMGLIDLMMFSINPAYDYGRGDMSSGSTNERMALYRRCETEGVGISVMKAFAGGQLLRAKTSPFGKALTRYQCLQYALDKPGVLTVLPGVRGEKDLKELLGFPDAPREERDYSAISTFTPEDAASKCVYCSHCQPCPAGLNIALINKYYDLASAGDQMARDHYDKLERKASDCIGCGHCTGRCPFHVDQQARMQEIRGYFGA